MPDPIEEASRLLLLGHGNRETFASLTAAGAEYLSSPRGLHTLTETMRPFSSLVVRLKRALHGILRLKKERFA